MLRLLVTAIAAGSGLLLLAGGAALAAGPDVTPPVGTLTIDDGSRYTANPLVQLHVSATDDVGVVSVTVFDNGIAHGPFAYAETLPYALIPEPYSASSDGSHWIHVDWADAAGNQASSNSVAVVLDRQAPVIGQVTWPQDPDPMDAILPVSMGSADGSPVTEIRLSSDGATWSQYLAWEPVVEWHFLDPALGGSPTLGVRRLYAQVRDGAGNVSAVKNVATSIVPRAPIKVTPEVPVTGEVVTLTPQFPGVVKLPAGTTCEWMVVWGNDRSLYFGERDDTFGYFYVYGPASGGFCKPLAFTVPWMLYRQVIVSLTIHFPGTEDTVQEWVGGSPDAPAIHPAVGSTSRRITWASMPIVYVLPDSYALVLGEPTTYRAYALGGARITSADLWSVSYVNVPEQHLGGTSFTFTPRTTGFITVNWGTDSSRNTRWAAGYDPPVRRRDSSRPNTSAPVQRVGTGQVGAGLPVSLTWTGTDRGWGIAKYQLDRSIDGGSWFRVVNRKTTTYTAALPVGHAYRFRVRAIDKAGNVGSWDVGPSFRSVVAEDGSASLTYRGTWALVADPAARGGSLRESGTASSAASFTFTGRDAAWLAERGPGHGRARVYVDGRLAATVDLAAATDAPARIVFRKHWTTRATHTIRVVVDGTAGRPIVGVDGFAVLR